jgi:hypothetical protein
VKYFVGAVEDIEVAGAVKPPERMSSLTPPASVIASSRVTQPRGAPALRRAYHHYQLRGTDRLPTYSHVPRNNHGQDACLFLCSACHHFKPLLQTAVSCTATTTISTPRPPYTVVKMSIQVTRMTPSDIDGAIDTIQQAFAEDPYNRWIYPDRSKVPLPHTHPNPPLTPHRSLSNETASPSLSAATGASPTASSTSRAPQQTPLRSSAAQCGCHRLPPPHRRPGRSTSPSGPSGSPKSV